MDEKLYKLIKERYGIVGRHGEMQSAIDKLIQAAPTDLSILITGETGTGKEVFANAVHGLSERKKFPFVSVNCGAIPETLLESELFGHEKGAFTGASDQRAGFFESAHRGTIFLDEIGEMPVGTQVKLLRILESGEFSRLGSSAINKVDVRLVAATNRNLENSVRNGTFRQDLFFRLNSVHIVLPPLREHTQDIPELASYYSEKTCAKLGIPFIEIAADSLNILKSLPWPGNVRELRNLIETVITLEKTGYITPDLLRKYIPPALPAYEFQNVIPEASLARYFREEESGSASEMALIFRSLLELKAEIADMKITVNHILDVTDKIHRNTENLSIQTYEEVPQNDVPNFADTEMTLSEIERTMIESSLSKFDGNRRKVAQMLGISERTLYRKLKEYGLE